MGFNIGRFFGSIAPEIGGAIGGVFGGQAGALFGSLAGEAVGAQLTSPSSGTAVAATVGRVTQPGPVSVRASSPQFQGGGVFFPSSVVPTAQLGALGRAFGRGGTALQLFGNGNGNGNPISRILARAREATGGPVTRNKIIDAAKACGLETAAGTFGIDVRDVCLVIIKGKTRRRRGVSAADIRRTKRTIGFASRIRKDLKALAR